MNTYRQLTNNEIDRLEQQGCNAENWLNIHVAEDFTPTHIHDVVFKGVVKLGVFDQQVEIVDGFYLHSGIRKAMLCDVSIGDNCVIENIGTFVRNYTIDHHSILYNVGMINTMDGATFGEGNTIAVGNEAGEGNILLTVCLNSQLVSLMMRHSNNKQFKNALFQCLIDDIESRRMERGYIGEGCKIINTKEITNSIISSGCEINGASQLMDCTLHCTPETAIYIGNDVVCENVVITYDSSITHGACLQDCFVGEACRIGHGFNAQQSVFIANCHLSCGEAVAAYCGPFSGSHHKSSLLIGVTTSFYNAGSATNFSNHAYKMGPLHHGILSRGTKTGSRTHILLPAHIGAYSVCLGKVSNNPDTRIFPFSYLIADSKHLFLVPGRNLISAGLYRDAKKWLKRDNRTPEARQSILHLHWLSPYTVSAVIRGMQTLEKLQDVQGDNVDTYNYHGYIIKKSALNKGIQLYHILIHLYLGELIPQLTSLENYPTEGYDHWIDLGGMYLTANNERKLVEDIAQEITNDVDAIRSTLQTWDKQYPLYNKIFAYKLLCQLHQTSQLTAQHLELSWQEFKRCHAQWIDSLMSDAEKEYALGDVDKEVLDDFLTQLNQEKDNIENTPLYTH